MMTSYFLISLTSRTGPVLNSPFLFLCRYNYIVLLWALSQLVSCTSNDMQKLQRSFKRFQWRSVHPLRSEKTGSSRAAVPLLWQSRRVFLEVLEVRDEGILVIDRVGGTANRTGRLHSFIETTVMIGLFEEIWRLCIKCPSHDNVLAFDDEDSRADSTALTVGLNILVLESWDGRL
jgi:hypothetical protein